jgi:hypothetical protein
MKHSSVDKLTSRQVDEPDSYEYDDKTIKGYSDSSTCQLFYSLTSQKVK